MEEIVARLIEIGRNAHVPNPHTVYTVEDPGEILPFPDRSVVDNICFEMPVGHLERFPFSYARMVRVRMVFYRDKAAALEDAHARAEAR
jgi:hypothetical protein